MERQKIQRTLDSWLAACNLPSYIKVNDKGEAMVDGKPIPAEGLLAGRSEDALPVFHKITKAMGKGKPTPVNRGESPAGKVHGDFILKTFRHCEFRRAPDPRQEEFARYIPVVKNVTKWMFIKNKKFFQYYGMEQEDLLTWGLVWFTNFLHMSGTDDENQNCRLLTVYLRQRFNELRKFLAADKNYIPVAEAEFQPETITYPEPYVPEKQRDRLLFWENKYHITARNKERDVIRKKIEHIVLNEI